MDPRPFPSAVDAERALLGCLLQDSKALALVDFLAPEDFYQPQHGALFRLLLELYSRGDDVDIVSISVALQRGGSPDTYGGVAYVLQLPDHAPSTANARHYADIVKEKAQLRALIAATQELTARAYTQPADVESLLGDATKKMLMLGAAGSVSPWTQVSEIVDNETTRIEELSERGGETAGHTTGFVDLDKILSGLNTTDLLILAARPAMGKTALALNIALNVAMLARRPDGGAEVGLPVGVFSLEMGHGQLVTRLLCCEGEVHGGRVRTGKLTASDWERFFDAAERIRKLPIHIDETPGLTISKVKARARRLKAENPNLGLIVIDYLQLMSGDDARAPREQQISTISRGLKGLAKELNIPVLALSQLNRSLESRQDKRPKVSDLRESGAIEQDADVIMFIYRDEVYDEDSADKGIAEVIIAKQRNGPTGRVKLIFKGEYARFDNHVADEDVLMA